MAWTQQWRKGAVDRVPDDGGGRLLGGEACLWSELVDENVLDVRLWSRLPAIAERFWSRLPGAGAEDLRRRLDSALAHLPGWAGVDVPGDVRRLAHAAGVQAAWQPLVEMLEPVKWYGRLLGEQALAARLRGREMPKARPYGTTSALDRVADGLPPESTAALALQALLQAELDGDSSALERLQALAAQWRDLPADAGPAELAGPAARLSALGELVLDVLAGAMAVSEARRRLQRAAPPQGEYLLAPVPLLMSWIEARIAREGHGQ
jgi:hexosaminidase